MRVARANVRWSQESARTSREREVARATYTDTFAKLACCELTTRREKGFSHRRKRRCSPFGPNPWHWLGSLFARCCSRGPLRSRAKIAGARSEGCVGGCCWRAGQQTTPNANLAVQWRRPPLTNQLGPVRKLNFPLGRLPCPLTRPRAGRTWSG